MAIIGYQASHEQFKPSELLDYVTLAEQAGFGAINSSDHFHPWSKRQGQSGFAFAWLGAAMRTSMLPFGLVCSPGQRYHPAIIAQAVSTLSEMYPERFWIAVGSGEALNERITGDKWPVKSERNLRLQECVQIMRRLLNGETVTHHGSVVVEDAKLYTLPVRAPLIIGAAVSTETAGWMAAWADGIITINHPLPELRKLVKAFRQNGGEGKPMYIKVQLSYAQNDEEALMNAWDQWRTNIFTGSVLGDLWRVDQFDALGEMVKPEQMKEMVHVSSNLQKHVDWIKQYIDMGFEKIILHNVGRNQKIFLREFGEKVLPLVKAVSMV